MPTVTAFVALIGACERGGRWSDECRALLRHLADHKAREAQDTLREALRHAWASRWRALLAVAAQDALAASLAEASFRLLDGHDAEEPPLGDLLAA